LSVPVQMIAQNDLRPNVEYIKLYSLTDSAYSSWVKEKQHVQLFISLPDIDWFSKFFFTVRLGR